MPWQEPAALGHVHTQSQYALQAPPGTPAVAPKAALYSARQLERMHAGHGSVDVPALVPMPTAVPNAVQVVPPSPPPMVPPPWEPEPDELEEQAATAATVARATRR
jgi:hypothetical protein